MAWDSLPLGISDHGVEIEAIEFFEYLFGADEDDAFAGGLGIAVVEPPPAVVGEFAGVVADKDGEVDSIGVDSEQFFFLVNDYRLFFFLFLRLLVFSLLLRLAVVLAGAPAKRVLERKRHRRRLRLVGHLHWKWDRNLLRHVVISVLIQDLSHLLLPQKLFSYYPDVILDLAN